MLTLSPLLSQVQSALFLHSCPSARRHLHSIVQVCPSATSREHYSPYFLISSLLPTLLPTLPTPYSPPYSPIYSYSPPYSLYSYSPPSSLLSFLSAVLPPVPVGVPPAPVRPVTEPGGSQANLV